MTDGSKGKRMENINTKKAENDISRDIAEAADMHRIRGYTFFVMKDMNLIFMIFLSWLIAKSITGYAQYGLAQEFLHQIPTLPMRSWQVALITILGSLFLLLVMRIEVKTIHSLILKTTLEIGVGVWMCYVLGFSYTGIILVILADVMQQIPKENWKVPVFLAILLSMIMNYDAISRFIPIISLDIYLNYYSSQAVNTIEGIKVLVEALNMGMFLCFVILLVREQVSEKERILYLNKKLYRANKDLMIANLRLEDYAQKLEDYAQKVEEATETRERNRLAREIHDTLGHALTGIVTGIEACLVLMDIAPEATKVQLNAIANVARQGMKDVRRSVNALRPDALEKSNLDAAIRQCIAEMRQATGADIIYDCSADLTGFHEDEEDIIYRIVQESVTNAIRHGKADFIQVGIHRENQMLHIRIKDNGCGAADVKKGFGLHHMQERIAMLQGSFTYDGSDGFTIDAQIPIRLG